MIGPFRTEELNQNIVDKLHLDADKTAGLKKTLITFPIISDTLINLNLIPVISTGFDKEKFEVHHYAEEVPKIFLPDSELFYGKQSSETERMQMLEERYDAENQMLKAISEGNAQKALEFMGKMSGREVAERFSFSSRKTTLQKCGVRTDKQISRPALCGREIFVYFIREKYFAKILLAYMQRIFLVSCRGERIYHSGNERANAVERKVACAQSGYYFFVAVGKYKIAVFAHNFRDKELL